MKWVFVGAALHQAWKKPLFVLNGWWQSLMGLVAALPSETWSLPRPLCIWGEATQVLCLRSRPQLPRAVSPLTASLLPEGPDKGLRDRGVHQGHSLFSKIRVLVKRMILTRGPILDFLQ